MAIDGSSLVIDGIDDSSLVIDDIDDISLVIDGNRWYRWLVIDGIDGNNRW